MAHRWHGVGMHCITGCLPPKQPNSLPSGGLAERSGLGLGMLENLGFDHARGCILVLSRPSMGCAEPRGVRWHRSVFSDHELSRLGNYQRLGAARYAWKADWFLWVEMEAGSPNSSLYSHWPTPSGEPLHSPSQIVGLKPWTPWGFLRRTNRKHGREIES